MSDDVPPARQCTMPDCPREALDPTEPGSLCAEHAPTDEQQPGTAGEETTERHEVEPATAGGREVPIPAAPPSQRDLYLEAWEQSDADRALIPHEDIAPTFEKYGLGAELAELGQDDDWTVWTPDSRETPLYAYTPDLAGDTSGTRERLAELLADAGTGTERFIDTLDGQKGSFDTANAREPDDPEIQGNYGVKGGRGGDESGAWLVDIDVDDYDEAKESNPRVEELRGETLAVASAHTTTDRPGHLYVLVDGDPRAVVRDVLGRKVDNPVASFGEIRVDQQYVVGPGSEIVCGCEKCTDPDAPEHVGRYELASEQQPITWTEDEFRDFLLKDPQIKRAAEKAEEQDDRSGSDGDAELSDSADARLKLAKAVDDYVNSALQDAINPDDRSEADAGLARSIAPWVTYDDTAIEEILDDHGTSKWQSRGDSYRDSVVSYANQRSVDAYETVPYWAVVEYAVAEEIVEEDALVTRDSETGDIVEHPEHSDNGTYRALPSADAYQETLEAIEDLGVAHGRDASGFEGGSDQSYTVDPRDVDIVLNPARAWRAAALVEPADLDDDARKDLSFPTTDSAWSIDGQTVDVVRAVGVAEEITTVGKPLSGGDYDRAYRLAREHYGAPLPEYVTEADAADRYEVVVGAIRELDFFDLDAEALTCDLTAADGVANSDVEHYLDPTPMDGWRDSESGESVLVFDSGVVWDADTEETIDALRLVALDAGLIDTPGDQLAGDAFEKAYRLARNRYGAPLPRWEIGTPEVEPVLPPAEDLVEDVGVDDDDLDDARGEVEQLYRQLARGEGDTPVTVLQALPSLGKTTSAIKTAATTPTAYFAPRKELMEQAADKAKRYGASHAHLPVFGGSHIEEHAIESAIEAVREEGQSLLRNRWALAEQVDGPIFPDDTDGDDDVELNRATCSCAEGAHGDAWALAVHAARELDYTPRDIHERAEALFGAALPCQEDGPSDDCEYSRGWDDISDPDRPIDLVIGSYQHANVESARTYYDRDGRDRVERTERALVLDEFVGDAFTEEFGDEFIDHAVWLATALRSDIEDRQDLFDAELWNDEWVHAWLRGDGDTDGLPGAEASHAARTLADVVSAVDAADEFLDGYGDFAEQHNLKGALTDLRDAYPGFDASKADEIAATLERQCDSIEGQSSAQLVQWLREDIAGPLESYDGGDPLAALPDTIDGDLRGLVEDAVEAATENREGGEALLRAAATALGGGDDGCRELAVHADDGYAHRLAHRLLEGVAAPDGDDGVADVIETDAFAYDLDGDGTRIKHVRVATRDGYDTVLIDRNHNGASVLTPPARTAGNAEECPVVGLDATARKELWSLMLGVETDVADIHESQLERARFLRDQLGLQVVRTAQRARPYEGDPSGKDLDGDVALLEEIHEQFAGVYGAGERRSDPVTIDGPAAITTKCVRGVLEDDERLDDVVSAWDNYGNITGDNELGEHCLAAVLGTQHYGDHAIEKMAALAGEEVTRSGHGHTLDYGSEIANTYLQHMREDQTMQAILRFARGGSGAVVFAHTSALRDDLPVVGEGQVVKSWSESAATVADTWKSCADEAFTVADVADSVDVSRRQVRRILDEFSSAGYLTKHETGDGHANRFSPEESPTAGIAELPDADVNPDTSRKDTHYTANVRVWEVDEQAPASHATTGSVLPAPDGEIEAAPPG